MSKLFRMFLLSMALMASMTVHAQAYVGDYTMSSSVSGYSSIASTGTQLTSIESDDAADVVSLPFTFEFGEETYTSVYVSSNGQIGLSGNPASSGYMEHTDDMSVIVPMGLDFNLDATSGGGHVYYEIQGYAPDRWIVIEYDHVRPYSNTPTSDFCSFQVVLHETGDIEFYYDTCNVSTSQDAYAFLYENSAHSMLALTGSWNSLAIGHTASPLRLSSTSAPMPGLNVIITRTYSNCMRPTDFICRSSSNPDSVVLAWTPAEYTDLWEVRYDTVGTSVDSMTHVYTSITDSFYICSGLHLGGSYEAYVRTDCGGEQSFWVGPIAITPGQYIMPTTGTHTYYGCGGVIFDDGGSTGNYSNNCSSTLVVYPSNNDSIVVLSGTVSTESCCDYLRIYDGVGTTGTLLFNGQGLNLTIPTIRSSEGPVTLYFYSESSVVYAGFEVHISCEAAPQCRYINDVEVSNIAGASALVSWSMSGSTDDPAYFIINTYNLDDASDPVHTDTTSNLSYFVAGLNPSTNYRTVVSSVCGDDIIVGDSVEYITRCLVGGLTSPSGTGTSQITGVPVNSSWGNTFCQSIFTPAELTAMGLTPGPIQGLTYTWASAGSYQKELVIFLGHTTVNTFSGFTPLSGSMTQVYQGVRNTTDVGTVEYYFTTPFVWDGTSNLVVSSFVNQPSGSSHSSSGFNAYSTNCSATRSIYAYRDGTAYTTSTLTGSSSTSSYRPNISFIKPCDSTATCAAPNVIVTNVGETEATVVWAPGYQETSWDVYYRLQEDTAWTYEANTAEQSYTLTNLQPMHTYVVKIVPDCGADSVMGLAELTTPCVAIASLPFNEDFEHFTASSSLGSPITDCWHRGTSYPSSSYPYLSTSYAHSGTRSIYFYAYSTYYSYLALPAMGVSMDSLQVSFAAYKTSASYSIQVGVMTDPEDYSTFTPVASVTPDAASTWQMFEIPLSSYHGNGQYIAFACGGTTSYMYLDDVEVSYASSCPRPTNVSVTGISRNSATVHWTDTATHLFEVEYGHSGFAHGTGLTVTTSDDSVRLYGLNHSTSYDVYIRGLCDDDTSNWSFVHTFATECGAIDSLPYGVNFVGWGTGTSARPGCWTCGGYSNYPYITNVADASGNTIGQTLYMYAYSSPSYAIMPALDSVSYPIETTQVLFRAWTNSTYSTSYSHKIIVGVVLDNAQGMTTFTPADTIELTAIPTLYDVSFEDFAGTGKYIAFASAPLDGATYNYAYLDSVAIELIPDCQSPNRLTVSGITHNAADFAWNERGTANSWQIEYGPRGFVPGTGTVVTANTNPFTITGLSSATDYEFYVRSSCDVNVYSEWSRTPGFFATRQNPAPVPYHYDFEDGTEWGEWQTNSNVVVNWHRGTAVGDGANGMNVTGTHAMYISADTGRTCSTNMEAVVNAAAYRDFDFGTSDTSLDLTFRAKAGGSTTGYYDGLGVILVDPDIPVVASSANLTTPWGGVNDLQLLTIPTVIHLNLNWNTYTVHLEGVSGVKRLAFIWFNQATGAADFLGDPAAVDEVRIDYLGCPRPSNFRTENLGVTTADVSWVGPEDGFYRIYLRERGITVVADTVHTNRVHFTGLGPGTTYTFQARRICSETDSSDNSANYSFKTKICGEGVIDTIGDPATASTSYYLPVNNYYNYTYSQQIYTASELSGAGEINALNFYYTGASAMTSKTQCSIYLAHTSLSTFATTDDYVPYDSLTLVYTGTLNCAPGWNSIMLNNSFLYNGDSNLVLVVDDNSGAYNGTAYTFAAAAGTGTPGLYFYSDSYNPNPASLSAFSGTRTLSSLRNVVSFEICPPSSCPAPVLLDPIIRRDSVVLHWRNSGVGYQLSYGYADRSTYLAENITLTDSFYVLRNLPVNRDFRYMVRQFCDSASVSGWSLATFNSGDIPCLPPSDIHTSNITNKSVKVAWTPEEGNTGYNIHLFNSTTDRTIHSLGASKTVSGLEGNTTYYIAVQAECADYDDPSTWSDTIYFTTDVCPDVSNVTTSDVRGNSAVIDWTEGGRATEWEIQWGPQGFSQTGDASTVLVSEHPYTLTGLIGETDYDVYVRAKCGNNFFSQHWAKASFSTQYSGITNVGDDSRIQLSPNPTSSDVLLTMPCANSTTRVEVIDIAGRVLRAYSLTPGTERYTLEASKLQAGAYYIRVKNDDYTAVKKLIVR